MFVVIWSLDAFWFSPQDDCLLKVWYNVENWRPAVTSPDKNSEKQSQGEIDFSFVYLAHPRAVNGFSWRKISKYMPRSVFSLYIRELSPTLTGFLTLNL